jgi:hypothetical protein
MMMQSAHDPSRHSPVPAWAAASLLAACALSGCTTLRVTSDVNTAAISSVQCHTFSWAGSFHGNEALRGTIANPVNESRLRAAIQENLGAIGVQPASSDPDCLVGYGIGMRNVVDAYPYGWGGWGGWGWGPGFYGGWGWDYPYVYSEGMIGVDLYDARSKKPLWHASVDQNLAHVTGEKADRRIRDAVSAIFTKYPKT